jgi:hypothetical protein
MFREIFGLRIHAEKIRAMQSESKSSGAGNQRQTSGPGSTGTPAGASFPSKPISFHVAKKSVPTRVPVLLSLNSRQS